jgi:hypothetical protein
VAEVHGQSQKVRRLKTSLGWRMYEIKSGCNRVMRSSVKGTTRPGMSCARGGTK